MNSGALEAYFAEADDWDADRTRMNARSRILAWRVAAAGWLCAVACAVALATLVPLEHVEPFVIRVDNTTGIVDVVPVYAGGAPAEEAVTRYFLTHYLTVCERFNLATAESDYEECGAFHSAKRNQRWYAEWSRSNPASPLIVHQDGSSVRVEVQSVSFFTRSTGLSDVAHVRYVKALRQPGGNTDDRITHWIATIQFAYGAPAKDPRTRRWNPLGFKIVEFTTEPEAAVDADSPREARHES